MTDFLNLPSKEVIESQNIILQTIADKLGVTTGALQDAINLANQATIDAENKIVDVENRFQTLTTEQQQDAEVIDARQGKTSLVANIQDIKDDLMSHKADFTQEIEKITSIEKLKSMGVAYGEIKIPDDFRKVPCDFYRDVDGVVKHNYDFDQHKKGTRLYVNRDTGNDTTGDGSSDNPYKTVTKAVDVANSGNGDYVIVCQTYRFDRGEFKASDTGTVTISGKSISIIPEDPSKTIIASCHQLGLSWEQEGQGTWRTSRNTVGSVVDIRNRDFYGIAKPLSQKETLAECQSTPNSWYTDGSDVFIHTKDGLQPTDENFTVNVEHTVFDFTLLNDATLYVENIEVHQSRVASNNVYVGGPTDGSVSGTFVANGLTAAGGKEIREQISNGIATQNIKNTYLFNCKTAYTQRDGFNYHYHAIPKERTRECLVLEYNCLSYKNGLNDYVNGNNNASTSHKGNCTLRVNSVGFETTGPVLADVTGCYSILIDCSYGESLADWTDVDRYVAYEFYNDGGKVIMINCNAHGNHNHLYASSGIDVYVQRINMTNIKMNGNLIPFE